MEEKINYYNEIKNEFINCEVYKRIKDYSKNRKELETYYNVGKLLIEAQGGEERAKYGNALIKEYSLKLTNELGRNYNTTTLKRTRQFYLLIQKGAPMAHQLSWSHYVELLSIKNTNEINYYIEECLRLNLSKRELREKIKNHEYQRLNNETKKKLILKEETTIEDFVKNPIVLKTNGRKINSEKVLQMIILENIEEFLKELGPGFCFIGSEYKIKIENTYNYIDLLLYNIKYNCYVVIELKNTELKKEHIGQIVFYMNYVDKNIKTLNQDKTIGIIICKKNHKYIIDYCSDSRILSREYVEI